MAEALEAELNKWSVQELKDVLEQHKLPTSGLKKALIARLVESKQYTLSGPDYDRWTLTALKEEGKRYGVPSNESRRGLINKLKQAETQQKPTTPPKPSPKGRSSTGPSPPKAASPSATSPNKRRLSSSEEPTAATSPSPTVTISPRRRKLEPTGPISKRETSPIFGSPSPSPPPPQSPPKRPRTPEKQVQRASPPRPTPVKSILSPRKARVPGETPKKVILGDVAIRHFPRCHGGSLGMPHSGGYAIGLDWKHAKETKSPIHEYERLRHGRRKSSNDLEPMTEERRKEIAEATGPLEELEVEDEVIRLSRTRVGCSCEGADSCNSRLCVCVAHGIACSQDACDCDDACCRNELRDRFESEKVDKLRKEKLVLANQELQNSNSSPLQNLGAMVRSGVKRTLNFLSGSPPAENAEVPTTD